MRPTVSCTSWKAGADRASACLHMSLELSGENRLLRILVNPRRAPGCDLLGSIGHELQHALEALGNPNVKTSFGLSSYFRRIGPEGPRRSETPEAIQAGLTVEKEACTRTAVLESRACDACSAASSRACCCLPRRSPASDGPSGSRRAVQPIEAVAIAGRSASSPTVLLVGGLQGRISPATRSPVKRPPSSDRRRAGGRSG